MTQSPRERIQIAPVDQIPDRVRVAQGMWTDTNAGNVQAVTKDFHIPEKIPLPNLGLCCRWEEDPTVDLECVSFLHKPIENLTHFFGDWDVTFFLPLSF